jgi:hypothetical protein
MVKIHHKKNAELLTALVALTMIILFSEVLKKNSNNFFCEGKY